MENPIKAIGHKIDEGVESALTAILHAFDIKARRIALRAQLSALLELDPDRAGEYQTALDNIKH